MAVKTKIVALVASTLMALVPLSQVVCASITCHSKEHPSSKPCHGMSSPKSDEALGPVSDDSCCRFFPALPAPARDLTMVQRFEQKVSSSFFKSSNPQAGSEHPLDCPRAKSPPGTRLQFLTCVLLI